MTLILMLAVALITGMRLPSRWALLLPLTIGFGAASIIAGTGHSLSDTPIPFLIVVCTLVMLGCQASRPTSSGGAPTV